MREWQQISTVAVDRAKGWAISFLPLPRFRFEEGGSGAGLSGGACGGSMDAGGFKTRTLRTVSENQHFKK